MKTISEQMDAICRRAGASCLYDMQEEMLRLCRKAAKMALAARRKRGVWGGQDAKLLNDQEDRDAVNMIMRPRKRKDSSQ